MDVFSHLIGGDDVSGANELTNIKPISGPDNPNDPSPAALEGFDDSETHLVLSDDAFVYPNRDDNADPCAQWTEEGMTQDMYLLGSILLHEYTHRDSFLVSIHHGQVIDQPNGYGWKTARALDRSLAIHNGDSYGWYATEFFWAVICVADTGYDPPDDDDDDGKRAM